MCGRINVSDHDGIRALLEMMGMPVWPVSPPRFNVPPMASIDVVTMPEGAATLELQSMRWGFANRAQSTSRAPLFNARSETVFSKPTFRTSALKQRAVVVVNGYYEWQRHDSGIKQAYHINSATQTGLFLAAIFQPMRNLPARVVNNGPTGEKPTAQQLSFELDEEQPTDPQQSAPDNRQDLTHEVCVLTTAAISPIDSFHHRMPVILSGENAARWITQGDESVLNSLIQDESRTELNIIQVSDHVNSVANDGPDCVLELQA